MFFPCRVFVTTNIEASFIQYRLFTLSLNVSQFHMLINALHTYWKEKRKFYQNAEMENDFNCDIFIHAEIKPQIEKMEKMGKKILCRLNCFLLC
ncbi:CLUMA_CG003569, isoform A [Clunio marinus]|uniref:CLUMA_CG003569, isoform A n=1 Tax=Clunio marinus TaxID=568069 RepID=A0A1J1HQP5_9DIPT|nr:CLUMA_CG003569, isoform A [Clunio marinus]